MGNEEKKRYSAEELKEFEQIILEKLEDSRSELTYLRETLSKKNDSGTDKTSGNSKVMEDGAETAEKENMYSWHTDGMPHEFFKIQVRHWTINIRFDAIHSC